MKAKQLGFTAYELTILILIVVGGCGWIANIVKLVGLVGMDSTITGMMVVRVIGVFIAPLGAVLGFL